MRGTRAAVVATLLALLLTLPGCLVIRSDDPPSWLPRSLLPTAPKAPTPVAGKKPKPAGFNAYLVKGGRLVAAERSGRPADTSPDRALGALLAGPSTAERRRGLSSAVPKGTGGREVSIDFAQTARVDLTREFASGGPQASVRLRVAQVVYTLTQLPGIGGVLIKIEGKRVEKFGKERIDLLRPQTRADYADLAPSE